MTRNPSAHRADFSVRCACGMEYTSSNEHIGRSLRCKCGRMVEIQRPPEPTTPSSAPADGVTSRRKRRTSRSSDKPGMWRNPSRWSVPSVWRLSGEWRDSQVLRRFRRGLFRVVMQPIEATRSRSAITRWMAWLALGCLALMLLTWALLAWTSESFLPATLLAYGPRFPLLVPVAILGVLALLTARETLLPLVLSLLVVLGPIMGGRVSWRSAGRSLPALPAPGTLRVMSFNTFGGMLFIGRLEHTLETIHPDLVALQECGDELWKTIQSLKGWHVARQSNLCTISRWPIELAESMPRSDFARIATYGMGGTGLVQRLTIATPHGTIWLVNLHLETARKGLEALAGSDGLLPDDLNLTRINDIVQRTDALDRISLNAQIRERESERAAVWASHGATGTPLIVAGDFNMPVESTIFRRNWSHLTDAFEASGTGFGWSKREGKLIRIRIDHILVNAAAPEPVGTWLGPDLGSDHLPVIADFRWR